MLAPRPLMAVLVAAAALAAADAASAGDSERGRRLYENHCTECHTDGVHFRERSKVRHWSDVLTWVGRWQGYLALRWTLDDMEDVAAYLDEQYYHLRPGATN